MPTSQFWTAEERIPISQKKVSVQAENGLSYELGQKVNFVIPPTIGFMMPSETYLRMDVKLQLPTSGHRSKCFTSRYTHKRESRTKHLAGRTSECEYLNCSKI